MQFIQDNEWYKVVRITGPAHNLLGLAFGNETDDQVTVEPLPIKNDQISRISAEEVRQHVLHGVMEANQSLGTQYQVKKIQFVPADTPPPDIYRTLAKTIVERLANKKAFVELK
jgi:hypothetical protein